MQFYPEAAPESEIIRRSLRYVIVDGIFAWTMVALTTGAFIVDFALLLGATNFLIGLIAAIPFLGSAFQLPAILLIMQFPKRRFLTFVSLIISRSSWLFIGLIPFIFLRKNWLVYFPLILFFSAAVGAIANAAWNSWMKDLIPERSRGIFFSRRLSLGFAVSLVVSLLASWLIDLYKKGHPGEQALLVYMILFLFAAILGLVGAYILYLAYEPPMFRQNSMPNLFSMLRETLQDVNFRRLLVVTTLWSFALSLSGPFFPVFMFKQLHLRLSTVISLGVLSQIMNIFFLTIWGKLVDRFGNKPVFNISALLFMLSLALWLFTALPEPHQLTLFYLVIIHFISGIAIAGVVISSMNIVFKLAPAEKATSYLAVNGTFVSLVSAIAPFIGGFISHYLGLMEFAVSFKWHLVEKATSISILHLSGLKFLFILSILLGIYSLNRLGRVKEMGEAPPAVVYLEFIKETRRALRNLSTATGIYYLMNIPTFVFPRRQPNREEKSNKE